MASPPEANAEREEVLRARGNVLYAEVAAGGGGQAAGKRSKLQRAQQQYEEALDLSCSSEKRASCCKNLGALHYLWAKVELELMPSWNEMPLGSGGEESGSSSGVAPSKISPCTKHLGQAVSFFLRAHVEGTRAQKPHEWRKQVGSSLIGLVTWAAEQSRVLVFPGAPIVKHVCEKLEDSGHDNLAVKVEAEALANLELADCLFQQHQTSSSRARQGPFKVAPPFACTERLRRASRLLESLPPSATTTILRKRVDDLESDLRFSRSRFLMSN